MDKHVRRICTLVLAMGFLLGIRDGRLALWQEGSGHPLQIYDIRADTLPPADQLQLRRGIRLQTRQELWQVLENYMD